jgi:hypothetical protein
MLFRFYLSIGGIPPSGRTGSDFVAVFAYLFLKSINVSELLHMMSIGRHMSLLVYSLDGFGEYDGIMSRRRIRASRNHEVKAC